MIACFLCKKEKRKKIRLCSKRGLEFNCCSIIAQHFWLKPNAEKNPKDRICLVCWRIVREFHQFYQSVAEAHNYLECHDPNTTLTVLNKTVSDFDADPIPIMPVRTEDSFEDTCASAEFQLEINGLELTPEVQVFETEVYTSDRALRAAARQNRRQHEDDTKLVLNESINEENSNFEDNDSEIELPLSMFLKEDLKSQNPELSRPSSIAESTVEDNSDSIELGQAQNRTETEDISDNDFASIGDCSENSLPLITENRNSDSGGWSDIEAPERVAKFAPLPVMEKPKKRRIRIRKPACRRMTKEEIETKRLDQEKYDEIISKLFDNFPCPKCNLLVCTFGAMRKHFSAMHNGKAPSVMCCGRRFPVRKALAEHVSVHLNPEHFKCSECGKSFQDRTILKRHEKTHEPTSEEKQIFNCHICSRKLSSKCSLKDHFATKHKPKSEYEFACKECPEKKFPTKTILKKHMQTSHRSGGAVLCETCGKSIQSKGALRYHIQNEHSNEPRPKPARAECHICKKSLRDEFSLKQHIISLHEDIGGDYRCHICGYLSVNERALKRHILYNHETERKFKCTMCDKAFKRSNTLKEHISTHTGEGLYTCPECWMTFACKANFHKHKQRRHGFKPVKRNLVGLAEKKRQKLKAAKEEHTELLLCYSTEESNGQSVANSL